MHLHLGPSPELPPSRRMLSGQVVLLCSLAPSYAHALCCPCQTLNQADGRPPQI